MMVSAHRHRAWIKSMAAFPPGLVFLFCCAVSMASAQSKTATALAPATAQAAPNASGPARAGDKTPANPEKPMEKVQDLATELKELRDVQIGLVLTLAACGDEPHCVSGVNHQEISSMQERLRKVTEQLGQETPQTQESLREALQTLEKEADNLRTSVVKVETEIDETKLEGDWSDQFVFDDFNAAPAVPFPNEKVPLVRFEDAEQPLPLE